MKLRFLLELSHAMNNLIVPREAWQARPPTKELDHLSTPVLYVVIHHSYIPAACYDRADCSAAMRQMQDIHMNRTGWVDIGMNFAIGGDGDVYEGCGWQSQGAHARFFNSISLGIVLIGNWRNNTPSIQQMNSLRLLLSIGVEMNYIREDYRLVGHRQVGDTDCPGTSLYNLLQTWDHYSIFPNSYKDLLHVIELPEDVKKMIANSTPTETTARLED